MDRKCKNSPDSYCYICGSFTLKRCKRQLLSHVMKLYELYFGCKVGDQDKRWAPHVCCVGCSSSLSAWYKGTGSGLTFGVPMIWREPLDHSTDCYFCLTDIQGLLTHLYSKEIVIQFGYFGVFIISIYS